MAYAVKMPQMGLSEESCILAKWIKKKGESVKAGDVLFNIETDKSTFDVEAEGDGILLDIFFNDGDEVAVMTNVCVIGQPGESTSKFSPAAKAEEELQASSLQSSSDTKDLKISPRARKLAEKTGVDYKACNPSGPHGRIIERDINELISMGMHYTKSSREYAKAGHIEGTGLGERIRTNDMDVIEMTCFEAYGKEEQGAEKNFETVKLNNIRKIIAKNMTISMSTIPQLTYNTSFDATEVINLREKIKSAGEKIGTADITINDIILFAAARTLPKHKYLNAHMGEDSITLFNTVNLGVAVDTDRGLMVPTVFAADKLSLNEISIQTRKIIEDSKKGTISPDLLRGGTFTVSNLGSLGIESFTPIINPPQTGILGISNISYRTRLENGEASIYPAMGLSLTCDHRAIDGAPSARFLKDLVNCLENITLFLAF